MSEAVFCNRCGKLFRGEDVTFGTITGLWNDDQFVHLCDSCKSKLDDWLNPEAAEAIKEYLNEGKKSTGKK